MHICAVQPAVVDGNKFRTCPVGHANVSGDPSVINGGGHTTPSPENERAYIYFNTAQSKSSPPTPSRTVVFEMPETQSVLGVTAGAAEISGADPLAGETDGVICADCVTTGAAAGAGAD